MTNPALPADVAIGNGEYAEHIARSRGGVSREAQDRFAVRSHRLAAEDWGSGIYDDEIVQVPGAPLVRDEGVGEGTTLEWLVGLRALFAAHGTVTAGNASSISDGASAVLVAAEGALGGDPLAWIADRGSRCARGRPAGIAVRADRGRD